MSQETLPNGASGYPTSVSDAITYRNSEILWSLISKDSWDDAALLEKLHETQALFDAGNYDAVNNLLTELAATKYGDVFPDWAPVFPNNAKMRIVFDGETVMPASSGPPPEPLSQETIFAVTLLWAPPVDIPPSPLQMVPYAL